MAYIYIAKLIAIIPTTRFAITKGIVLLVLVRVNKLKVVTYAATFLVLIKGEVGVGRQIIVRRTCNLSALRKVVQFVREML